MSDSKKEAKTKVADLMKFSLNNAKESYKTAFASYVQFLVASSKYYYNREHLVEYLRDVEDEILNLIEFE